MRFNELQANVEKKRIDLDINTLFKKRDGVKGFSFNYYSAPQCVHPLTEANVGLTLLPSQAIREYRVTRVFLAVGLCDLNNGGTTFRLSKKDYVAWCQMLIFDNIVQNNFFTNAGVPLPNQSLMLFPANENVAVDTGWIQSPTVPTGIDLQIGTAVPNYLADVAAIWAAGWNYNTYVNLFVEGEVKM